MEKHEEKHCPKCNAIFTCKLGDIINCQCSTVELTQEASAFLYNTNFNCLCKDCLIKINQDTKSIKAYQFPAQKEMLIEGLHFYKENGNWVFTELYHYLRGYCCNSGCRHCVYGFNL